MKPIDSLIIRLPVGSGWSLYEAAFGAAQRFREEPGITLCGSGGHEFRARWTGKGAVVVEVAPEQRTTRPRAPKPPAPRKARASVMLHMPDAAAMVGTVPDAEVARTIGVSRQLVSAYRTARGIPKHVPPPPAPAPPKPPKVRETPMLDSVKAWAVALGRPFTVPEVCGSGCFRPGSSRNAQQVAFFRWLSRGHFVAVGPDPARQGKASRAKLYALAPKSQAGVGDV